MLQLLGMEDWFRKTASVKYNFAESGVPNFTLKSFCDKIKVDQKIFNDIYLGNNDTKGSLDIRNAISGLYRTIKADNLLITNGSSEALYIFFNMFVKKDTKVMLLSPAFPPLYVIPQNLNAKVFFFDVLVFKNKNVMFESLLSEIDEIRPELLIINIPHNPTGITFDREQIRGIGKAVKKNHGVILFDEHYRFLPISSESEYFTSGYDIVSEFYKNVFAVGSIIKCTGIVGVRVGWLIGDIETLKKARDYKDYTTHCVSMVNERIATLAIKNIAILTKDFKTRIKENWSLIQHSALIKEGKVLFKYDLDGGCVVFPKIRQEMKASLSKKIMKSFDIAVMPGFFLNKDGYLRINLAQKTEDFNYLINAMNSLIR